MLAGGFEAFEERGRYRAGLEGGQSNSDVGDRRVRTDLIRIFEDCKLQGERAVPDLLDSHSHSELLAKVERLLEIRFDMNNWDTRLKPIEKIRETELEFRFKILLHSNVAIMQERGIIGDPCSVDIAKSNCERRAECHRGVGRG